MSMRDEGEVRCRVTQCWSGDVRGGGVEMLVVWNEVERCL